ncbi:MAG: hypothetical protein JNM10_16895 [Planctomycetia bacterium]|nr:hypothetical protein [Planctomycetia bacterium]
MSARPPIGFVVVLALLAEAGCGGGGGGVGEPPPPDPVIAAIEPATVWRDETTTVRILGSGTAWDPATPPLLVVGGVPGPAVVVEGPGVLRFELAVAYDADLGPRSITVQHGTDFLPAPPVTIDGPAVATWFSQPFVRGSVLVGAVAAHKPGVVVSTLSGAMSWDGTELPLFAGGPQGFVLVVPETATVGPFDLVLGGTGPSGEAAFRIPAGAVRPRTKVHDDNPVDVTLPTVDGTALHRVTATVDGLVELPILTSDVTPPIYALFPHQGPFAPPVIGLAPTRYGSAGAGPRTVALVGDTFDVVVYAGFGTYRMEVREVPAVVAGEGEPNDRVEDARPVALPALVHPAEVDADGGDDWYAVPVAPEDVGRVLRVVSSAEAGLSVAVVAADGATVLASSNSSGAGGAIDLRSTELTEAGTVYVRVGPSSFELPPPSPTTYKLFLRLEAP